MDNVFKRKWVFRYIVTAITLFLSIFCIISFSVFPMQAGTVSAEADTVNLDEYDSFLVYRGTYDNEQYALFDYIYGYSSATTSYKQRRYLFNGVFSEDLQYGDLLVTDNEIKTKQFNSFSTYLLDADTSLTRIGNCYELLETKMLTIESAEHDTEPEYPISRTDVMELYKFRLSVGETYYGYQVDYSNTESPIMLTEAPIGDSVLFAMFHDRPLLPMTEAEHIFPYLMGDVNMDGVFGVADVVLLQKWLLAVPETELSDWLAADFCEDKRLNVFDLCLMKRALLNEQNIPHCTMTVITNYGGHGFSGQDLGSGSFTETFTVSQGDVIYETDDGHWLINARDPHYHKHKIATVADFNEDQILFTYESNSEETTIGYGESKAVMSTYYIADGINYDYVISFSDFRLG